MNKGNIKILCTGGAGYIGSHTVVSLLEEGYCTHILDNFSNSDPEVINRIEKITGKVVPFYKIDIRDKEKVLELFKRERYDAVIHFAGLKAVGISVSKPLEYYENNVVGTIRLLEVMKETNCNILVFSSSATVYLPKTTPLIETDPLGASNPYGQTKYVIELILKDVYNASNKVKVSILRYFNPVGCHQSSLMGEDPEEPNNLLPFIQLVSIGKKDKLYVFGNDWPTKDGTGVRDYIHVLDLAEGHIKALEKLLNSQNEEKILDIYNLGCGTGVSVLEMVKHFEDASGRKIPFEVIQRRQGDLATVVANPSKAERELGWKAKRTIFEACKSAFEWQFKNPNGYSK
ncbi:UDP-glucose 4-epimerase [Cryptosporidium xiaoi]|uniref:UDP-glucose 4-epimerase n=1 Tax=Cryptosporidium xiaoi TaxID=659607 RepID=A0AAV9XZK6_9CRYT